MPDLLAHALLAYSVCRVLSWRVPWLDTPYVTLGMAGAFVPDLVKVGLVVPEETLSRALGIPFGWGSLETGGGVLLSVLVGVVLLAAGRRRRGALLLGVGAGSHLLADALLRTASGRTVQLLWPLSGYRLPSPGLYLSTQPGPAVAAGALAGAVYLLHRTRFA
jgi:hypothetical protein